MNRALDKKICKTFTKNLIIRLEPKIQHKKAHMTRTSVSAHTSPLVKLISKNLNRKVYRRSALLACCLQKSLLCLHFYKCVLHFSIKVFLKSKRLTRGDVWAKPKSWS